MESKRNNKKAEYGKWLFALGIPAAVRTILSVLLGVWFPAGQIWDDSLVMEYADFAGHFGTPNRSSLLKTMGYPLFLKAVSVSGIPYTIVLGLIWTAAALFVFSLVRRLAGGKRLPAYAAYLYVLFLPQAFDFWSGTRMYRNGMIAPFVLMTFSLLLHVVADAFSGEGRRVLHIVLLGLFFSYTYYLKEDGLWLMACLLFGLITAGILFAVRNRRAAGTVAKRAFLLALPLVIWAVVTAGYKAVNDKYFGVFETNTRTEGEYGKFMEYVYKVDSPNRSLYVWASFDAIDSVFAASPALSSHPELLEAIHNTGWAEELPAGHEIPGDHFAFALREEMYELGMFTSEAAFQQFFKQVNGELKAAFVRGTLKKADRIQLLASTGGYTREEVQSLFPLVSESFKGAVLLKEYRLGLGDVSDWEIENLSATVSFAKSMTHISYLDDYSGVKERSDRTASALQPLLAVYRVLNVLLFMLLAAGILLEAVYYFSHLKTLRTMTGVRVKIMLQTFGAFVFLGISVCYAFSISWFSAFCYAGGVNMTILNFYNIALPGLLAFAYIFILSALWEEIAFRKAGMKQIGEK